MVEIKQNCYILRNTKYNSKPIKLLITKIRNNSKLNLTCKVLKSINIGHILISLNNWNLPQQKHRQL